MHKVHCHVEALAVDLLFARPVKVELFENVFVTTDRNATSRSIIDQDRMAVVDNVQRRMLVLELDRWQVGLLRIANINRGLMMPILTRRKLRLQITPMTRPELLAIIPSVLGMMLLGGTANDEDQRAADDGREGTDAHCQPPFRQVTRGGTTICDHVAKWDCNS